MLDLRTNLLWLIAGLSKIDAHGLITEVKVVCSLPFIRTPDITALDWLIHEYILLFIDRDVLA